MSEPATPLPCERIIPIGFLRQIVDDTTVEVMLHLGTEPWDLACEWLRFHDLDPNRIPGGSTIEVDRNRRQIRYLRIRLDEGGNALIDHARDMLLADHTVQQGEALAPFPPALEAEFADGLRWLRS